MQKHNDHRFDNNSYSIRETPSCFRVTLLLLPMLFLFSVLTYADNAAHQEAAKLKAAGQYAKALTLYEQAFNEEAGATVQSACLLDMGDCYSKLNEKGKAIAAYHKLSQLKGEFPAVDLFMATQAIWELKPDKSDFQMIYEINEAFLKRASKNPHHDPTQIQKAEKAKDYCERTLGVSPKISAIHAQNMYKNWSECMNPAPLIKPQSDGTIFMNMEAAGTLQKLQRQLHAEYRLLTHPTDDFEIKNGAAYKWKWNQVIPCWKIAVPEKSRYLITMTSAAPKGRESEIRILALSKNTHGSIDKQLEPTPSWITYRVQQMGILELEKGTNLIAAIPIKSPHKYGRLIVSMKDIRAIPVGDIDIDRAILANGTPEFEQIKQQLSGLQQKIETLDKALAANPENFTDYRQFIDRDKTRAEESQLDIARIELENRLQLATASLAASSGIDDPRLAGYARALACAYKAYPKEVFKGQLLTDIIKDLSFDEYFSTLKPVIGSETFNPELKTVKVEVSEKPSKIRTENFQKRNSDQAIEELCREFYNHIKPGQKGLESFYQHYSQERYKEALEAYKWYFFKKLEHPAKYGSRFENIYDHMIRASGRDLVMNTAHSVPLAYNRKGFAVVQENRETLVGEVGRPGEVTWAPDETNAQNQRSVTFYTTLQRQILQSNPSIFSSLFYSYYATGSRDDIDLWLEYLDDWTMHVRQDIDSSPDSIRSATSRDAVAYLQTLQQWGFMGNDRKQFRSIVSGATLARWLLFMNKEYIPYTFRNRRAHQGNHGIFGITASMQIANFLTEFKVMDYFRRESWRLWMANMIQHRTLDGENIETIDAGHNGIDVERADQAIPFAGSQMPPEFNPMTKTLFSDHLKTTQRNWLVHVTPDGEHLPQWGSDYDLDKDRFYIRNMQVNGRSGTYMMHGVDEEPYFMQRFETLRDRALNKQIVPEITSDVAPYAGMFYLRDSWQPTADMMMLRNFTDLTRYPAEHMPNSYFVSKNGLALGYAAGIVVDRLPANTFHDRRRTGGRMDYSGQAGENVVDTRFFTSDSYNFAESKQDAPYSPVIMKSRGHDIHGIYQNKKEVDPITDITAYRQVFAVKGEGLYIVNDRIENQSGKEREYAQFFTLPARIPNSNSNNRKRAQLLEKADVTLIEENEAEQCFRSHNLAYDNLSIHLFGKDKLSFINRLDPNSQFEKVEESALATLKAYLDRGLNISAYREAYKMAGNDLRPLGAYWKGKGNQNLVSVNYIRPAAYQLSPDNSQELKDIKRENGSNGILGFSATTRKGTQVWFQGGPQLANHLQAGFVRATAESLLATKNQGGTLSGIALSCSHFEVNGRSYDVRGDFEFTIDNAGEISTKQIYKPIDTVRIRPEAAVFTDRINVSFSIPTQDASDIEYRYTLDGTDPTLASPLYTKPFSIDKTTLVKVRPYRKGLQEDVWNIPGVMAGKTVGAIFSKQEMLPATEPNVPLRKGLAYDYYEDYDWPTLFSYVNIPGALKKKSSGTADEPLVNVHKIRQTEKGYAIVYNGYIKVADSAVYTFTAPDGLYDTTMDAGYDMRVWIDGKEWFPSPTLHARNQWSIALSQGYHLFCMSFVDYRYKTFRNEQSTAEDQVWLEEQMFKGMPELMISSDTMNKQRVPPSLFYYDGPVKATEPKPWELGVSP